MLAQTAQPAKPERSALDVLLRCFAYEVGAEAAMVLGRDAESKTRVLAIWGLGETEPRVPWTTDSLLGRAFDAPGALVETQPTADRPGQQSRDISPGGVAVAAPIVGFDGRVGAIYASFATETGLWIDRLRWVAESYAGLAALCMNGDKRLASTLIASRVDRLTGCLSREALLDALDAELQRARRQDDPLSCCFMDLDGFKGINDTLGHLEGNRVLAAVGAALLNATRPYDTIGRFGGDEFVLVLPNSGATDAGQTAGRMGAKVAAAIESTVGFPGSVSTGVAEWDGRDSADALLESADAALGEAKRNGGASVARRASSDNRNDGLLEVTRTSRRPTDPVNATD